MIIPSLRFIYRTLFGILLWPFGKQIPGSGRDYGCSCSILGGSLMLHTPPNFVGYGFSVCMAKTCGEQWKDIMTG